MFKRIQTCPQRNKDLTVGYLRRCHQKCHNLPQMIAYIVLSFIYNNSDKFKLSWNNGKNDEISKNIIIRPNCINTVNATSANEVRFHAFLDNVVSEGIHIWVFHIAAIGSDDMVGIVSEKHTQHVYGLLVNHNQLSYERNGIRRRFYTASKLKCHVGDMVTIKLDCNEWKLFHKINEDKYIETFHINSEEYSAVIKISTCCKSSYKLIKYQMMY